LHFYGQVEEYALVEEGLDLLPGRRAQFLDRLAALAEQDRFFPVVERVDHGFDPRDRSQATGFGLLEGLDGHLATVGDLLAVLFEDLAPDDLAHEEAL